MKRLFLKAAFYPGKMWILALMFLGPMLWAASGLADVLVLTNGERLEGVIEEEKPEARSG
jgi:hypothetical protein